jgi:acid phosphatase
MRRRLAVAMTVLSAAVLCAQITPTTPTIVFPRERIDNLGRLKQDIKNYYACTCTCGCYRAELDEQAERALQFLKERLQHRKPGERLAIVLDIDETSLSNYAYYQRWDFGFDSTTWGQWVQEARATAIPGTLRVFKEAKARGVGVFFITGRGEAQRAATESNLRSTGYDHWDGLTLRAPDQANMPTIEYKSAARQKIASQGYTLLLNIGDQLSDLQGTPSAELNIKMPDPFYYIP